MQLQRNEFFYQNQIIFLTPTVSQNYVVMHRVKILRGYLAS